MERKNLLESAANAAFVLDDDQYTVKDASGEEKTAPEAAPATSENNMKNTPKGGGDKMTEEKKTQWSWWKVIGVVIGATIIALLIALLLTLGGCDGIHGHDDEVANLRTQLAAESARADAAEKQVAAESARADAAERQNAAKDDQIKELIAKAGGNTATATATAGVSFEVYQALLDENAQLLDFKENHVCNSKIVYQPVECKGSCDACKKLREQLAAKDSRIAELEESIRNAECEECKKLRNQLEDANAELKKLRNHVCPEAETKVEYRDKNWYYLVYVYNNGDDGYQEVPTEAKYLPDDFWEFALDSNPYANGSYGTGGNGTGSNGDEPYGTGGHKGNDPLVPGGGGN